MAVLVAKEWDVFLWALKVGYRLDSRYLVHRFLTVPGSGGWLEAWLKCSRLGPQDAVGKFLAVFNVGKRSKYASQLTSFIPIDAMDAGRIRAFRIMQEAGVRYPARLCHSRYIIHLIDEVERLPEERHKALGTLDVYRHLFLDEECWKSLTMKTDASSTLS